MPKPTALNPKLNLIRTVGEKVAPAFRRFFGEMARVQINPSKVADFVASAEGQIEGIIQAELGRTGLPIIPHTAAWPAYLPEPAPAPAVAEGEALPADYVAQTEAYTKQNRGFWVYQALAGRRNFAHARYPVGTLLAHVKITEKGPEATVAGVHFPIEDLMVLAESGKGGNHTGSGNALGRMRTAVRAEPHDALLLMPWKTADEIALNLQQKAEKNAIHTRKSGHPLFDVLDVALGRADAAILTRVTPLELAIAKLLAVESGAVIETLPVSGDAAPAVVVANPALAVKLVGIFS